VEGGVSALTLNDERCRMLRWSVNKPPPYANHFQWRVEHEVFQSPSLCRGDRGGDRGHGLRNMEFDGS
jgi:hypothetical protein